MRKARLPVIAAHIVEMLGAKLDNVHAAITEIQETLAAPREEEPASYTIKTWRQRHKISESAYHKLRRAGKGPKTMAIGTGVRISREADEAWIADREAEASAKAIGTRA